MAAALHMATAHARTLKSEKRENRPFLFLRYLDWLAVRQLALRVVP